MKISFSTAPITFPGHCKQTPDALDILKSCDLVFSVSHTSNSTREQVREVLGDKYIPLNSCPNSRHIVDYLYLTAVNGKHPDYHPDDLQELHTIYQMLPKGVELTLYCVDCFERKEPPVRLTLPYEN